MDDFGERNAYYTPPLFMMLTLPTDESYKTQLAPCTDSLATSICVYIPYVTSITKPTPSTHLFSHSYVSVYICFGERVDALTTFSGGMYTYHPRTCKTESGTTHTHSTLL